MSFRVVRQSKFRHVFGKEHKRDECYDGIKLSKAANETPLASVNSKFFAVVLEAQGGGAFLVQPLSKYGRIDLNAPKVTGHTDAVVDVQFCPYNENLVASASNDLTVMVWDIPNGGLTGNLSEPLVTLRGHQRRIGMIHWHPLAENIILSVGHDYMVLIWDIASPDEPIVTIDCHEDIITSIAWNLTGDLLATTCKDKQIRVIEACSGKVISQGKGHDGSKNTHVAFVSEDSNLLFTTGFSKMSERQYAVWNSKDLSKYLKLENIDQGSGVQLIHYDPDTRMVYCSGKGDGNIRYFEVTDEAPYVHQLSQYQSSNPQRGVAFFPKTACNVSQCEVARVLKLHPKGFGEVISFIVPRKSTMFQDDIFPDTREPVAVGTAADFKAGKKFTAKKVSLKTAYKAASKATTIGGGAKPAAAAAPPAEPGVPQGAELVAAWKSQQDEIKGLRKQIATLEIKLRAAMKSLDGK